MLLGFLVVEFGTAFFHCTDQYGVVGVFFAILYLAGVVAFMGFRILSLLKEILSTKK